MEIKYTLEILTKDIQDIGKLVENLQNSPEGSKLELDLALSKLRNVYDILTMIREDIGKPAQPFLQPPAQAPTQAPVQDYIDTSAQLPVEAPVQTAKTATPPPPVEETPEPEPEPIPGPVTKSAAQAGTDSETQAATEPATQPAPEPVPEPKAETPKPEPVAEAKTEASKPEPVAEAVPVAKTPAGSTEGDELSEAEGQAKPQSSSGKDRTIIAEKYAAESSINENLAGNRESGLDSKLLGQPIDHIGRHIGINDRFLIIRELFDGDSDGFGKLIQDLDNAGNLQSASEKLHSQFSNTPDHEGVDILNKLVKRKYSQS